MPYSYTHFDRLSQGFLKSHLPTSTRILDVGAGAGKYSKLLNEYTLDCIEVFKPYIEQLNLKERYRHIYTCHVSDFDFLKHQYDTVIFGDVLEHLSIHEAQQVLKQIFLSGGRAFVAVPYQYQQDTIEDNPYERHLQPDLTPAIVAERYPRLHLLHMDEKYGLYTGPTNWIDTKPQIKSLDKAIN